MERGVRVQSSDDLITESWKQYAHNTKTIADQQ